MRDWIQPCLCMVFPSRSLILALSDPLFKYQCLYWHFCVWRGCFTCLTLVLVLLSWFHCPFVDLVSYLHSLLPQSSSTSSWVPHPPEYSTTVHLTQPPGGRVVKPLLCSKPSVAAGPKRGSQSPLRCAKPPHLYSSFSCCRACCLPSSLFGLHLLPPAPVWSTFPHI